jgi:hypothetical protein
MPNFCELEFQIQKHSLPAECPRKPKRYFTSG